MKINDLKTLDTYGFFFVTTTIGEDYPLCEAEAEEADMVDIACEGWQGKDIDGLEYWLVTGKGDGFTLAGRFYNGEDYKKFCAKVAK
jgi:hypothetical protein